MHDSVLVFYHLTDRIKIRQHTVLEQSLRIADVDHAVAVEVNIAGIVDRVEVRQHAVLEQSLRVADVNGGVTGDVAGEIGGLCGFSLQHNSVVNRTVGSCPCGRGPA